MNIQMEEVPRVRWGKQAGASTPSPNVLLASCVHQIGTPYFWVFMETSSYRHDGSLIPFLVMENGEWG